MKERIWVEDALKHIHELEYHGQAPSAESVASALGIPREQGERLLSKLSNGGLLELREDGYGLTDKGREYARHVIRAHRLYETLLARETGHSEKEWHHQAEKWEHRISEAEAEDMARRLGYPHFDPHGDPIPTQAGDLPPPRGRQLPGCPVGWEGVIVHIEDEPEAVYEEVVACGLAVGIHIKVSEATPVSVRLMVEGGSVELSRAMAALLTVAAVEREEPLDRSVTRLSHLARGERASVVGLSPACRGPERSRLLDLGVVPGTVVEMDLVSPSGNPVAYLIRGASVALRTDQAERVLIRKLEGERS
jgi:DtxR family Mn-dependent transcriptional regulator